MNPIRINLRHIEPGGSVQVVLTEIAGRCGPEPFLLPPVHRLPRQAPRSCRCAALLPQSRWCRLCPGPPDPALRTGSAIGLPATGSPSSAGTVPLRPRPGPPGPWWYSCAPGLPLLQKSTPVGRAGAVPIQHFIVELRPIALVFGKLVLGILPSSTPVTYRSRLTLARMEAAAMEALFPSPPTRHMWGAVMETLLPWSRLPSMRHRSGRMDNPSMARFIASIRALRISKLSISSAVTRRAVRLCRGR